MQIIIHRGTKEIGGSCVEVKTNKTRVLIDFGIPLIGEQKKPFDSKTLIGKTVDDLKKLKILPNIKGLYNTENKAIDGILISHSHMDHYGLLSYVHPDIPIYMSRGAKELIEISNIFTPNKITKLNFQIIKSRKPYFIDWPFDIGDIKVTPYQADHSAFDALAFLIEGDGKRLFYSGDFRGHGRKSSLKMILMYPPKDIDCLLMEGSMLGRGDQKYRDEVAVQTRMEEILKSSNNITFLFASSQNIDRIVSAYRACIRTGSTFVIDIYTAYILDMLRKVSVRIPQFNWANVKVKFYKTHADTLAKKVSTNLLYHYNSNKIELPEINKKKDKILMLMRDNSIFPSIVKSIKGVVGAKIIYSMWDGYLTQEFKSYCKQKGIAIELVHTSGHATVGDLRAFSNALKPKALIPIHTFEADKYPNLFEKVKLLVDREEYKVL